MIYQLVNFADQKHLLTGGKYVRERYSFVFDQRYSAHINDWRRDRYNEIGDV